MTRYLSGGKFLAAIWAGCMLVAIAQGAVAHDPGARTVTMADDRGDLCLRLNYGGCCYLDRVQVRGREVVASETGVCSAILVGGRWTTTRNGIATPAVRVEGNEVWVDGIAYAGGGIGIKERWHFTVGVEQIDWQISRDYLNGGLIDDTYFPGWDFAAMDTWTGGLLDTGGVAWCRYLSSGCSYGAHAGEVTFFNPAQKVCLRVTPTVPAGTEVASRFSHQPSGLFSFVQSVTTGGELATKQTLHRSTRGLEVWAPYRVEPGTVEVALTLQVFDDAAVRGRGAFAGLDGGAIGDLLDTIGRYGVVDQRIMGGNGWLTGWVCLHEPFFAQMGLAIGDPAYTANLAATLDDWRDLAMRPDGRVLSRWHHDPGDNMPGTYDPVTGYYECVWGYTLDSQPDYVINVAEQFDLSGDIAWLRGHKASCERALDWLLARDSDGDGLVEMMTDSHTQAKGSDWIDIVWASWENAFVNGALYEALTLWSQRETILGDPDRAARYRSAAARLREAYRRPIDQGGFWNPEKGWFVYWREPDDSIHGDNLVTPVNFGAVAYGLADPDQARQILDTIESRMRAEKLFCWPLCFESFKQEDVSPGNWPFPKYENGDIFLSWGELGVRAYAKTDPALALAYVSRVLDRYRQDGLSHQRYLRATQQGAGDDILAGNCMTIVGLYRNLYGVRPQWNRLQLDPHLNPPLAGTLLRYRLRQQWYDIALDPDRSAMTVAGFTLRAASAFAVAGAGDRLDCFQGESGKPALTVTRTGQADVTVDIDTWPNTQTGGCRWTLTCSSPSITLRQEVSGLKPRTGYQLAIDGAAPTALQTDETGRLVIDYKGGQMKPVDFWLTLQK